MNLSNWIKNLFKPTPPKPEIDAPINSFPSVNTGVLDYVKKDSDFVAGDGNIPYEVILPSGDYRPFTVKEELQSYPTFDSMGCTGYSDNNSAEIQLKLSMGLEYNFSDEALNFMAGCTQKGNYLISPTDTARLKGRILQKDWSISDAKTWADLQKPIPPEILAKAIFFNERYQWIGDLSLASIKYHLKQAPIRVIVNNGTHAVCLIYADDYYWYFDSYPPYIKKTTSISAALQTIVKPMTQFVHLQGTQEYGFYNGCKDIDMLKLKGEANGMPVVKSDGTIDFTKAKNIKFL
jgi:hypothetical protein